MQQLATMTGMTAADLVPAEFRVPPYVLYRLWCGESLAYVGQTTQPLAKRLYQHEQTQPWWFLISRVTAEELPDAASLSAAESIAIRDEKPWFNAVPGMRPRPAHLHGPIGRDGMTPEERIFFMTGVLV